MFYTYRKVPVIAAVIFSVFSFAFAYSGGTGELNNPYQIADANDLLALGGTPTDYNKCFILTADINMAGRVFTTAIIAADTVAGNYTFDGTAFTGIFDGNGYKITHFTIVDGSNDFLGLFGCISSAGSVKNLGLENCKVDSSSGSQCIGSLVGLNYGSVTNCYSTGSINGDGYYTGGLCGINDNGSISNCYSTSNISGDSFIGGLVGYKDGGSISNCYSTGNVSGYNSLGGLCGSNSGSITNCYSTSSVSSYNPYCGNFGGLCGSNSGSVTNCYSTGIVGGYTDVGGLCGDNSGSIIHCYSTGAVSGTYKVGGLVGTNGGSIYSSFWDVNTSGQTASAGGTGKTTEEMQTLSTFTSAGWDFVNIWRICPCETDYPCFKEQCPPSLYSGGSGIETDPYRIATVCDWQQLMNTPENWDKCFLVTSDVNLQGITLTTIGNFDKWFTGAFDGNGHTISYPTIDTCDVSGVGLFGQVNCFNEIKNLRIEDANIIGDIDVGVLAGWNRNCRITNCYCSGTVSGRSWVGGLIGTSIADIVNCNTNVAVNATDSRNGGLVGQNSGNITNCFSSGPVYSLGGSTGGLVGYNPGTIKNSHASGQITSAGGAGGLVGFNDGYIFESYAVGSVGNGGSCGGLAGSNRGTIEKCHAAGSVINGYSYIGGLVGYNNYGIITQSHSAVSVITGEDTIGGLVGHNEEGSINQCYSTASANGNSWVGGLIGRDNRGNISNCYSTGAVSGDEFVGGLMGQNNSGSVNACFWDVNTSGQTTSDGGEGKTTTEMKTLSTFTSAGWDFSYTDGDPAEWFIQINEYPILVWQISPADIYTDGRNNFRDFAVFAQYWMREDCAIYNYYCDWADLDFNGSVDIDDLIVLMSYWLQSGIYLP